MVREAGVASLPAPPTWPLVGTGSGQGPPAPGRCWVWDPAQLFPATGEEDHLQRNLAGFQRG